MDGIAAIKYNNGLAEGKCLDPFSYTDKTVIPEKDMQAKIKKAIDGVKIIKGDTNRRYIVYHNALKLMTFLSSQEYTKAKDYNKHL